MFRFTFPILSSSTTVAAAAASTVLVKSNLNNKSHPHQHHENSIHSFRSKAGLKLLEIDEQIGMFQKLEKFEILKSKFDSKSSSSSSSSENSKKPVFDKKFINVYSAVDFGASPGGFAQVLSKNLTRRLNSNVNIPHSVVTVDNREIYPKIRNTVHLRGGVQEHGTLKRIKLVMEDCNKKFLSGNDGKNDVQDNDDFNSPVMTTTASDAYDGSKNINSNNSGLSLLSCVKHRVVIVTNDAVAIIRNNPVVKRFDAFPGSTQRKYSVTYAQNNLVCCAMRRSLDLLDCFQKNQPHLRDKVDFGSNNYFNKKPRGFGSAVHVENDHKKKDNVVDVLETHCPPCFFISKILRSVHVNRVLEMAQKYFDEVKLLELTTSSSDVERYLVAQTKASREVRKPVMYRHLSLPPAPGEAAEWFCWGCLNKREGDCFKCPKCTK